MWVPMSKAPHWSRKRSFMSSEGDEGEEFQFPAHLMKKPKTEVLDAEVMRVNGMELGHSSIQGYRVTMEDAHIIDCFDSLPDHTIACILDGHAGDKTALYVSTRLTSIIEETEQFMKYASLYTTDTAERGKGKSKSKSEGKGNGNGNGKHKGAEGRSGVYVNTEEQLELLSQALVQAFINIDRELLKLQDSQNVGISGSTCVCSIITPSHILCANVGDSRCVLGTGAMKSGVLTHTFVSLSEDHKPSLPDETTRINNAGLFVLDDRVKGELAMSRALGDFQYKANPLLSEAQQAVTCYPDIAVQRRNNDLDNVLILACDGVWDVMTNEEGVSYLQDVVMKNKKTQALTHVSCDEAAHSLISLSLNLGSMDNISAIVINFHPKMLEEEEEEEEEDEE